MVAAEFSDEMLLNLAEAALKKAGWPTEVQTGRFAFELGNNVRNVADQKTAVNEIPTIFCEEVS